MAHGDNSNIWTDPAQRPREYAGLDWVNANSLLHPFVDLADPHSQDTLADIGTGTGAIAKYMVGRVARIVGVDISPAMLDQIDPELPIEKCLADARKELPFDDGYFDIVTTRMMLHDVEDPKASVKELWRILKPGGRLVAAEFVLNTALPGAVDYTDQFEAGSRRSAIVPADLFRKPSEDNLALHRELFRLKQEPERYLWHGRELLELFRLTLGELAVASLAYSLTPYNSVDNWLGRSGYDIAAVKQAGILEYLKCSTTLKDELDMRVTREGEIVPPEEQEALLNTYRESSIQERENMTVDVRISRIFANILTRKLA